MIGAQHRCLTWKDLFERGNRGYNLGKPRRNQQSRPQVPCLAQKTTSAASHGARQNRNPKHVHALSLRAKGQRGTARPWTRDVRGRRSSFSTESIHRFCPAPGQVPIFRVQDSPEQGDQPENQPQGGSWQAKSRWRNWLCCTLRRGPTRRVGGGPT